MLNNNNLMVINFLVLFIRTRILECFYFKREIMAIILRILSWEKALYTCIGLQPMSNMIILIILISNMSNIPPKYKKIHGTNLYKTSIKPHQKI